MGTLVSPSSNFVLIDPKQSQLVSQTKTQQFYDFPGISDRKNEKGPRTLILDLDETLIHSWERPGFLDSYQIYTNPEISKQFHPPGKPDITYSMLMGSVPLHQVAHDNLKDSVCIWGLKRPYLEEFIKFCFNYFTNILVWSAGVDAYVQEITKSIFSESGYTSPRIIWARPQCSNHKGAYHKPIIDIFNCLEKQDPQIFNIDPKSTLILDDKVHTFMQNPQNGVLIPPYYPGYENVGHTPNLANLLDRSDDMLLRFMRWLNLPSVRNAEDVRLLDKSQIFNS